MAILNHLVSISGQNADFTVDTIGLGGGGANSQGIRFSGTAGTMNLDWMGGAGGNNRNITMPDADGVIMLTSQGILSISGGTTRATSGEIVFSNSNGVSFGINGQTMTATVVTNHTLSAFAQSNTTQSSSGTIPINSLQFAGAGIASVGVTNGSIVISVPSGGGAGDGGVFAGVSTMGNTAGSTGTVSTGNFVLVGSGPISLSQSTGAAGSAATVTINAPATSSLSATGIVSISTNGSTISIGAGPATAYAVGNTTQSSSGSLDLRSISFNGLGILSVGISNGSIDMSVAAASAYAVGNTTDSSSGTIDLRSISVRGAGIISAGITNGSIEMSAVSVSAYAVGNTTDSSSGNVDMRSMSFRGAGNITVGISNGSIEISGGPIQYSYLAPAMFSSGVVGLAPGGSSTLHTVSFGSFQLPDYVSASMMNMYISFSFLTIGTSSGQQTLNLLHGLYTRGTGTNSTTISRITTGSFSYGVTGNNSTYSINQPTSSNSAGYTTAQTSSAGSNISSGYTGAKIVQFPMQSLLTPGEYFFAFAQNKSTSSVNVGISCSYLGQVLSSNIVLGAPPGSFSSAFQSGTNVLLHLGAPPGIGTWTAANLTSLPNTVALSDLVNTGNSVIPYLSFWADRT